MNNSEETSQDNTPLLISSTPKLSSTYVMNVSSNPDYIRENAHSTNNTQNKFQDLSSKFGEKEQFFNFPISSSPYLKLIRESSMSAAKNVKRYAFQEYVKLKNNPKRIPIILRYGSIGACLCLIPSLILDSLVKLLFFSAIQLLVNIYAIIGTILVLCSEWAKLSDKFGIRSKIHFYFKFLEYCVGLGCVQLFVASLILSDVPLGLSAILKFIPSIIIAVCGVSNIVWGFYAARKIALLFQKLNDEETCRTENENINGSSNIYIKRLSLMERKFNALDKQGDGLLTIDDLREGVEELHLNINEIELSIIFQSLDKNKDGRISKEEFETWWLLEKDSLFQ